MIKGGVRIDIDEAGVTAVVASAVAMIVEMKTIQDLNRFVVKNILIGNIRNEDIDPIPHLPFLNLDKRNLEKRNPNRKRNKKIHLLHRQRHIHLLSHLRKAMKIQGEVSYPGKKSKCTFPNQEMIMFVIKLVEIIYVS